MIPFRVLALDGGGMRGLYTATVLKTISTHFTSSPSGPPDIGKGFDLIAGTSTGGILACALAQGIAIDRIIALYRNDGPKIFRHPAPKSTDPRILFWFFNSLFSAGNSNTYLREVLTKIFADGTLDSLYEQRKIALCVPTVVMRSEQPKVMRTPHNPKNPRETPFKIVDVCLATSAAPMVLPLAKVRSRTHASQPEVFADGGLWANNPTLVGLTEALELAQAEQPIEIVSASAGPFPSDTFPKHSRPNLGLAHWGSGLNALSLLSNAQSFGTDYLAQIISDQFSRFGKKVTLVRLPVIVPPEEQTKDLRLDATSDKALNRFEQLGTNDGMETVRWAKEENNVRGKVLRHIFQSLPPLVITLCLLVFGAPLFSADSPIIEAPPQVVVPPTKDNAVNTGPTTPSRVLPKESPTFKNYWIPAVEIPVFIFLLNQADRVIFPEDDTFKNDLGDGWDHVVNGDWVVDQDDFVVNQIGHPYQGTIYYAAARSSGLNFWESWLYANAGSYLWETYGEQSDPSINDQIASGTGGALLGEPLYRLSNMIMTGGDGTPGFFRQLSATVLSPPTTINRWLFGEKYGPTLEDRNPPLFIRLDLGGGRNQLVREPRNAELVGDKVGMAKLSLDYGSPGDPDYRYQRPFDYFHLDAAAIANEDRLFDDLSVRGLLFGAPYSNEPDTVHGIWGLYGHFDYVSPQIFRYGSTAVSFGTTNQIALKRRVTLLTTALAGVGYASAGTITPTDAQDDFHYGTTPQALLALRLILGSRLSLDASGRTYYITDSNAGRAPGTEHINRLDTSLLIRIFGGHSLSCGYTYLQREADYNELPSLTQRIGTVNVMYSYVTDMNLGRVKTEE